MDDALQRACTTLGGWSAVARAAGASDSAPHMWRKRENVPAEYCPGIERETRRVAAEKGQPELIVTCEQLRPDVPWAVLRENGEAPPRESVDAGAAA